MGQAKKLFNPILIQPSDITKISKIPINTNPHNPSSDIHQLQADVLNVLTNKKDISDFPIEYQKKIKSYYQFAANPHISSLPYVAKRTKDTDDIM
jgi:hypothetical protein